MSKVYNRTEIDGDLAVGRKVVAGGELEVKGKGRSVIEGSLKVDGLIEAKYIKENEKGLFTSVDELNKIYPNPRPGWFALVLDTAIKGNGFLYVARGGKWELTDETSSPYDFIQDSINVFASKGELADETQRAQGAENILTQRIVNETVRAIEAENEIKKNAVKFNRIGITGYADKLELMAATIDGDEVRIIDIPAATETKAGVVSAEDKKKFVKSITWNNDNDPSNMNDFVVAGVYDIKGERTRGNDNLPILNTGGGHSFNARLTVLDSSISGSGKDDDKCITQVMSFNNRLGQGEVYIRTGKGASLENLTWENWSTLQRNVNVVSVESLGDLIDNGIYSGVLNPTGETFVLVVINNYALASKYGTQKCISQFKYSVNYAGAVVLEKRVKIGDSNWGSWQQTNEEWLNARFIELEDRIFEYIDKEIQDIIEGTNPDTIDSIKDLVKWVEEHGTVAAEIIKDINKNTEAINNETEARIKDVAEEKTRAEQAEQDIKDKAIEADSLNFLTRANVVALDYKTIEGVGDEITIPAATTENAGVMSAVDKQIVDNLEGIALKSTTLNELDFVDTNNNCVVAFADGHIKTKNFDSRKNAVTDDEKDKLKSTGIESIDNCDFAITDEQNNTILVLADGHIKTKNFDSRNGVNNTKFIDRDIYALGDSTTQGAGSGDTSVLGNKSWFDRLVAKIQFRSYRKLAANGTVTMKQEGLGALSSQIKNLPVVGNPIILVMIGTNDINRTHEKGNVNAALAMQYEDLSETVSFAEAFRYNLETIKRRLPNAEIIVMMPLSPQPEDESDAESYRDIERTICKALSIPVFEVRNECGISKYCNYGFAQVAEDEIENATVFMADALHPNNAGYERIANYVATKLNKYIQ